MKKFSCLLIIIVAMTLLTGFDSAKYNVGSLLGINVDDIEESNVATKRRTVALPYNDAYDEITNILKNNGLTIFLSNKRKGYIIVMGLPQQMNTTRVGIFFETGEGATTTITLKSLSYTALNRFNDILSSGLE
ncbi:MAG: hypothetical protein HQ594_01370 [Candidatus Omnitrophica bacterium]|nr:hypothetical protein [Candidatus Omnitrophota bacterium]